MSTTSVTQSQTFDLGKTYQTTSEDNTSIATATTNLFTRSTLEAQTRQTSLKAISTSLLVNKDLHSNETETTSSGTDLAMSEFIKPTSSYSTRKKVIPSYTFGPLNATHMQAGKSTTSDPYVEFVSTTRPETDDNTELITSKPPSDANTDTATLVRSAYTSTRKTSNMSILMTHTTTQIDIIDIPSMTLVPQTASSNSGSSIRASKNLTTMTAQKTTMLSFTQKASGVSTLSTEMVTSHATNGKFLSCLINGPRLGKRQTIAEYIFWRLIVLYFHVNR